VKGPGAPWTWRYSTPVGWARERDQGCQEGNDCAQCARAGVAISMVSVKSTALIRTTRVKLMSAMM